MLATKNLAIEAYGEFERLFRDYPAAVKGDTEWKIPELVLQHDGQVYLLIFYRRFARYSISKYGEKISSVGVNVHGLCQFIATTEIPSAEQEAFENLLPRYVDAMRKGVPQPRQGSLFGYVMDGRVQLLMQAWLEESEACWQRVASEGCSMVPDFLDPEQLPGTHLDHRFWDEYRVGNIVVLDELIANAPKGSVLWVRDDEKTYQLICRRLGAVGVGVYSMVDLDGERRPSPPLSNFLARLDQLEVIDVGVNMRAFIEDVGAVPAPA